ncbi:hypothetical protein [Methanolacinia petrolearia]|nr:hypothetical protein [Methanolacinia petrolearia]
MSFLTGLQTWISLNFSDFCDLLVAVGTIALAVVTFITLIYNKKTLDLSLEQQKKGQILDRIRLILNRIKSELEIESELFSNKKYKWLSYNSHWGCLKFCNIKCQNFYCIDDVYPDAPYYFHILLNEIAIDLPELDTKLSRRRDCYNEVHEALEKIKEYIDSKKITALIKESLNDQINTQPYPMDEFELETYDREGVYCTICSKDGSDGCSNIFIYLDDIIDCIHEAIFYQIFIEYSQYIEIIPEPSRGIIIDLNRNINEIFEKLDKNHIDPSKTAIEYNLEKLADLDDEIITLVDRLIEKYRSEYRLSLSDIKAED